MSKNNLIFNFGIEKWYALSEGLTNQSDWISWVETSVIECDTKIPVDLIPAMMRRRMSSLSKLATQVALNALNESSVDYLVFSSQHGELHRTVDLIKDILSEEDASPMAFSQSVHNTAAGLTTIAAKKTVPVTSIAAGGDTFQQALIEAYSYLSEYPDKKVLLVDFDDPLPDVYSEFEDREFAGYAVGYLLSNRNSEQNKQFSVTGKVSLENDADKLPQSINVLNNILTGNKQWKVHSQRYTWEWREAGALQN